MLSSKEVKELFNLGLDVMRGSGLAFRRRFPQQERNTAEVCWAWRLLALEEFIDTSASRLSSCGCDLHLTLEWCLIAIYMGVKNSHVVLCNVTVTFAVFPIQQCFPKVSSRHLGYFLLLSDFLDGQSLLCGLAHLRETLIISLYGLLLGREGPSNSG